MNKRLRRIFIFISFAFIVTINTNQVYAEFSQNIEQIKVGDTGEYNKYEQSKYKSAANQAIFSTKYQLDISANETCTLSTDDWNDAIKVGVAAIIEKANVSNGGMTENYYYAELAINEFLYNYNGKDLNNKISQSGTRPTNLILGDYYNYYEAAVNAYNLASKNKYIVIERSSGKDRWRVDNSVTEYANVYHISTAYVNVDKIDISSETLPTGVTAKIYVSKDNNNFEDNNIVLNSNNLSTSIPFIQKEGTENEYKANYIKIVVTGAENIVTTDQIGINVSVEGNNTYKYAENYKCSNGKQSITPNNVETNILKIKTETTMSIIGKTAVRYPSIRILKTDKNNAELGLTMGYFLISKYENSTSSNVLKESIVRTGSTGAKVYEELENGYYCVQEIISPNSYGIDDLTKHCFTVSDGGLIEENDNNIEVVSNEVQVKFTDTKNKITIGIKDENNQFLSGSCLKITTKENINEDAYILNEDAANAKTLRWCGENSLNSIEAIEELPQGIYYLYETKAKEGYALNPYPTVITINRGTTNDNNKDYSIINNKIVIKITRNDSKTNKPIAGVTLQILDEKGNIVKLDGKDLVWETTTEAKVIEGLPSGTYYLQETNVPSGYTSIKKKIEFKIDEYGIIRYDEKTAGDSILMVSNNQLEEELSNFIDEVNNNTVTVVKVPATLSTVSIAILVLGSIAVATGLYIYFYSIKQEK